MKKQVVRTSKILTGSYVVGDEGNTSGTNQANLVECTDKANQLVLIVDFTKGNLTSAQVKVELTYDQSVYAREANASVSAGTSTMSPNEYSFDTTGIYQILVPLAGAIGAKVSAKGTGADPANSLMAVDAYTTFV